MRRLSATPGYARFRLALGAIFVLLGVAIVYRTVAAVGLRWEDGPSFILGSALVILGYIRVQQSLDVLRKSRP